MPLSVTTTKRSMSSAAFTISQISTAAAMTAPRIIFHVQRTPLARAKPCASTTPPAVTLALASPVVPAVPWGGGSGTQGGCLPINGGIVIDLRSLDEIVDVDEVSMTVTVQAGVNGPPPQSPPPPRGLVPPPHPPP